MEDHKEETKKKHLKSERERKQTHIGRENKENVIKLTSVDSNSHVLWS